MSKKNVKINLMKFKKFGLYKLCRSKTKELCEKDHMKADVKQLSRGRYLYQLKYKLIEESKEVLRSQNKENFVEELGDVFETFSLLLKENNIPLSQVIEAMSKKQEERGPLGNNFLSVLEIPEDSKFVEIYTKSGYKEIINQEKSE